MKSGEAHRKLLAAGFRIVKQTPSFTTYEYDDEIRCNVSTRSVENPHTTRVVEQMIRRAEQRTEERDRLALERAIFDDLHHAVAELAQPETEERDRLALERANRMAPKVAAQGTIRNAPLTASLGEVFKAQEKKPEPAELAQPETEKGVRKFAKYTSAQRRAVHKRIREIIKESETFPSYDELAARLNAEGVKTPSGRPWERSDVSCQLKVAGIGKRRERRASKGNGKIKKSQAFSGSQLPPSIALLIEDESLSLEARLELLKTFNASLPTSAQLVLEDAELSSAQKSAVLAILLRETA